ncbi:MAG: hypothetical protein HYZ14_04420 [Bacteroidetes bacterium]|nr:hypothetical protein [Bacteroidota bacterium]
MKNSFQTNVQLLKSSAAVFNQPDQKIQLLKALMANKLPNDTSLQEYHDLLLFISAHPESTRVLKLAELELARISEHLKIPRNGKHELFADSGLPYTTMITRYSHDLLVWMQQAGYHMSLDSFEEDGTELNDLLKLTLPSIIRDETTAGLGNEELLDRLRIKPEDRLTFLLNEFSKLNHLPYIKDQLWNAMKPFISIQFDKPGFSKSYNCFNLAPVFFHSHLLKKFNHKNTLGEALPQPARLTKKQESDLMAVIRNSMIQTLRETDTATYMDESSLRYFMLDRGISVAIYGMQFNRQLPLQSYIGYTLFKNGFPAAYGGSWIYGRSAKFGLNVFEAFRGGESGLMMCELLRVYMHTFNLNYIEVDAFQFGKDNMDGIRSGAYWFYYRYGFRSLNPKLKQLAQKEFQKIKTKPGYRSSEKTLLGLAESNIALKTVGAKPFDVELVSEKVIDFVAKKFKGDMIKAAAVCKENFRNQTKLSETLSSDQELVLEEVALFAAAAKITDQKRLDLLRKMIPAKVGDPYTYNQLVIAFRE